jgi:hypothetical protein
MIESIMYLIRIYNVSIATRVELPHHQQQSQEQRIAQIDRHQPLHERLRAIHYTVTPHAVGLTSHPNGLTVMVAVVEQSAEGWMPLTVQEP